MFSLLGLKSRPAFLPYEAGNDTSRAFPEAPQPRAHPQQQPGEQRQEAGAGGGSCCGGGCGSGKQQQAVA